MHSFQWFSLFFLASSVYVSGFNIPRLQTFWRNSTHAAQIMTSSIPDVKTFYYAQRLDHFNYRPDSYTTFQQRYMISFKQWGGANSGAPIFAYFGAEESLDEDIHSVGFLRDNAPQFNALVVYIEHRYYGKSVPFGSYEDASRNASTLGYFNSAQALADYAAILLHIRKILNGHNSPIVVFGGSYGGMLASWFRLKYPHIAIGALASSAPIPYVDGIAPRHGYFYVVTKDFKETSESCYQTIRKSWLEIDEVAKKPHGLSILSKTFKTCKKLRHAYALKDYLEYIYCVAARYNVPPVECICGAIDAAAKKTDILGQIFEAVVAIRGNSSCYDINEDEDPSKQSQTAVGWRWQRVPVGKDKDDSMFQPQPFNMKSFINSCKHRYGIPSQPHWVTTYYGGEDMKLVFERFASNIIFSNGLKDPYSSAGVLESLSDSLVAVTTVNGSHCLDIHGAQPSDPQWLVTQRQTEINIVGGRIAEHQADREVFK